MMLEKILAALLWSLAGVSLFFFLLNRWALQLRDFWIKLPLMLAGLGVLSAGALVFGYRTGVSRPVTIPLLLLALFFIGEIRRLWRRRRMRGTPPISHDNAVVALHRPLRTTTLAIQHYEVALPPAWRGGRFRVALLSDLHLNGLLPNAYYHHVLERVTAQRPDLILLAGDFVCRAEFAEQLPRLLGDLRCRLGVYAILGNHDHWADAPRVAAALQQAGVDLIGNGCRRMKMPAVEHPPRPAPLPAGDGGSILTLWGCEDPWSMTPWQPPEPAPAAAGAGVVLALSHTADNVFRLSAAGALAVFAGHYHAGQLQLPLMGPLMVPSRFGRLFSHGHFVVHNTHLFVSAGIGTTRLPLRLYCQPDIFVVDFK